MYYTLDTLKSFEYALWAFAIITVLFALAHLFFYGKRWTNLIIPLYLVPVVGLGVMLFLDPLQQQTDNLYAAIVEDQAESGITGMGIVDEDEEKVLSCLSDTRPGDVDVWLTGEGDGYYRAVLVNYGAKDGVCKYQLVVG